MQAPPNHISGQGCPECGRITCNTKRTRTQASFIQRAKNVHGSKYDYSLVEYTKCWDKVNIICPQHGLFQQAPTNHVSAKQGCPKCGDVRVSQSRLKSQAAFIADAQTAHQNKYSYALVQYIDHKTKVKIICPIHGIFEQAPNNHVSAGQGCPSCATMLGFSYKCISWLNSIAINEHIFIQHAKNIGEYQIPNTRLKADGYCAANKTVYEFYGDAWHGNPTVYAPNDYCHPMTNKYTAKQLFTQTMRRERSIRSLGYSLVTIWESEYDTKKY